MTTNKQTPKPSDDTESTTKTLRDMQGTLFRLAAKITKNPRLSAVRAKLLEAETALQLALDAIQGQAGGQS